MCAFLLLSIALALMLQYAFQTNGALFLVMDFVNGGELFGHLKREGQFSESDARLWSAEILLALEYLHTMGAHALLQPLFFSLMIRPGILRIRADRSELHRILPIFLSLASVQLASPGIIHFVPDGQLPHPFITNAHQKHNSFSRRHNIPRPQA
jgi:serine/threonine protein kinase